MWHCCEKIVALHQEIVHWDKKWRKMAMPKNLETQMKNELKQLKPSLPPTTNPLLLSKRRASLRTLISPSFVRGRHWHHCPKCNRGEGKWVKSHSLNGHPKKGFDKHLGRCCDQRSSGANKHQRISSTNTFTKKTKDAAAPLTALLASTNTQ